MINLGKLSKNGKDVILEQQENGCIKCLSHCIDKDGYVRIRYNGKHDRLFRVLYQQKYGVIPKNMVLRHLCNNAWCCNVEHLKVGTYKENYEDMVKVGNYYKIWEYKKYGINNSQHKLIEREVKEIYLSKLSYRKLSKIYNVSSASIRNIKKKICWEWLTNTLD